MIVQLRLDERLIHGQITTAWSKFLTVNAIVVANDKLFINDLAKKTLLMSAPAGIKVTVRTVQGTIDLLSDPRSEKMRVLIIVDNPKDALTLAEALDISGKDSVYVKNILSETARMNRLIENLFSYARMRRDEDNSVTRWQALVSRSAIFKAMNSIPFNASLESSFSKPSTPLVILPSFSTFL